MSTSARLQRLSPRVETRLRRVLGAGLASLALYLGVAVVRVGMAIARGTPATGPYAGIAPDPHGFARMLVVGFLAPATLILAVGSVCVWRKRDLSALLLLPMVIGVSALLWVLL